ncbi:MAG: hypothetical protein ACTTJV_10585 [Ottowia sp.]
MKKMTVFKGTLISCSVVAIAFSLFIYGVLGHFSHYWIEDALNVLYVTLGGAIFTSFTMPLIFKKSWHWPMLIVAIPIQVIFSILIIIVVFVGPENV